MPKNNTPLWIVFTKTICLPKPKKIGELLPYPQKDATPDLPELIFLAQKNLSSAR